MEHSHITAQVTHVQRSFQYSPNDYASVPLTFYLQSTLFKRQLLSSLESYQPISLFYWGPRQEVGLQSYGKLGAELVPQLRSPLFQTYILSKWHAPVPWSPAVHPLLSIMAKVLSDLCYSKCGLWIAVSVHVQIFYTMQHCHDIHEYDSFLDNSFPCFTRYQFIMD